MDVPPNSPDAASPVPRKRRGFRRLRRATWSVAVLLAIFSFYFLACRLMFERPFPVFASAAASATVAYVLLFRLKRTG